MILAAYKFHPENDDKKHPMMEKICYIQYWMTKSIQYWMIIDDISHSIEKAIQYSSKLKKALNNHPNMDTFFHFWILTIPDVHVHCNTVKMYSPNGGIRIHSRRKVIDFILHKFPPFAGRVVPGAIQRYVHYDQARRVACC